MNIPSMPKKFLKILGVPAILWLAIGLYFRTGPVVVLHYSAAATEPVVYFFNENNYITKKQIFPGETLQFHTAHRPDAEYYIDVSLPFASRDGVEIKPPFSRVDVYIGADTKIARTVVNTNFTARFGLK